MSMVEISENRSAMDVNLRGFCGDTIIGPGQQSESENIEVCTNVIPIGSTRAHLGPTGM